MSDDAFRLMPQDLRSQRFATGFRGYDRLAVDEFLRRAADAMETLVRDRIQADERLKSAQDQLRAFRERERALNEALIAAQQLRQDSEEAARREADGVLRDARVEAERVVERAAGDERLARQRAEMVQRQFVAYIAGFRSLLERHLAELAGLETDGGAARSDGDVRAR